MMPLGAWIALPFGYVYVAVLVGLFLDETERDHDEVIGLATVWPLTLIYLAIRMLFIGLRYWARAMLRLAQRRIPHQTPAACDPLLEAAKREVEAIVPEHPDA